MKLLVYLSAALLLTASAQAAPLPPPANLMVYSESGQPFSFVLDGRVLTRPLARQVHVDLLLPGRHWAEVSLPTPYGPPLTLRTEVWLRPGLETSYVLVLRRWGPQLREAGATPLGGRGSYYGCGAPGPGGYYGSPGGNGSNGDYYGGQGGYGNAPSDGGYNGGYNAPAPAPGGGYNQGNYPSPNGGYNQSGYPVQGGPGNSGGYYPGSATTTLRPLAPADVAGLLQALRRTSFDSGRLAIARQALAQGSVCAAELAALVKALSFGDARVELAEFGYAHVSDPQNFYLVYGSFDFSANVREVQQALGLPQE